MRVSALMALLAKMPQDANVVVAVGWNADTAVSRMGEDLTVKSGNNHVQIRGWMPGCNTELGCVEDDA